MAQRFSASSASLIMAAFGVFTTTHSAFAVPTVWDGPGVTFAKLGSDDETQPEFQDRLTDNVWITRSSIEGPYNVAPGSLDVEDEVPGYVRFTSPDDTLWATSVMDENAGQTIAASNWESLEFTTWAAAYGGPGFGLIGNITTVNAVVWLVTDDIYLDLQFTEFNSGGDMTYVRSSAPAQPVADFNNDGVVDAADYVTWRKDENVGSYADWVQQFGSVIPGSGGTAVPEPSAAISLAATLMTAPSLRYIGRPSLRRRVAVATWPGEKQCFKPLQHNSRVSAQSGPPI